MRIDQLMRKPAVTCRSSDSLNVAAQRMWENDCGVLPVVDDKEVLVGIVTDRDICMAAYTQGLPLSLMPVSTAMAGTVFSCRPGDPLESAEELMAERQVRRLPVVDSDKHVLGVLSVNDIARWLSASQISGEKDEALRTVAAICHPRVEPRRIGSAS